MALYLVRSSLLTRFPGLRKNLKCGVGNAQHSLAPKPCIATCSRLLHTKLTTHTENTVLNMKICNTSNTKTFHSSVSLLKKFKESDYETVRILDAKGKFLCTAEKIILEKFCHHFHRYTFQEFKGTENEIDQSANASGDGGLHMFQLVDKRKESHDESKGKKMKVIKFHKDKSAQEKLQKIFSVLIEHGKVTVTFDKKGSPVESEVRHALQPFVKVNDHQAEKGSCIVAFLDEIESKLLLRLLGDIQKQEALHIANVKEMMNTMKGD